ncbi:MAG: DNA recombination protein RmuC [Candidatus Cloacimonetes bacterium]|nr:DNA recombination protein RmuC [Candidatus Cloacimonadota bacterium]
MIEIIIPLVIGLIVGIIITVLILRGKSSLQRQLINDLKKEHSTKQEEIDILRSAKTVAETKFQEAQKNIEEQKQLLKKATEQLTDTFSALSANALKSNSEEFLKLAKQNLETILEKTKSEFGKEAIAGTLEPLKETLQRYDKEIKEMEGARQKAYGGLQEQLSNLVVTHEKLKSETSALVNALKRPHVRGRWGEITLKRVVELVGMSEHCDFTEQISIDTEEGRLRPDLIVNLPGKRSIVIDAKAPLKFFLDANEAKTDEERESAMLSHAKAVRDHMNALAKKDYWRQFEQSPDFVVLFLPGDSFFSAALELDRSLIEDGINSKIIIATPTTLIALLRTVAFSWQQQQVAENAKLIAEVGAELYDRVCTFQEHLGKIGSNLDSAVNTYNKAVGSFSSRVVPGAKKLQELGVKQTKKEVTEIEPIETTIRELPGE